MPPSGPRERADAALRRQPGSRGAGLPRGGPVARLTRRWFWGGALLALLLTAAAGAWVRQRGPKRPAAPAALPALSIPQWLAGHSEDWRLAWLKEYPGVLVIEFPGLAEQGAAMNRIAALLEKAGAPRDQVLDDAQVAALIARNGDNSQTFYQGHDYSSAGLSRFYALARDQGNKLTPQELRLQQQLIAAGLLPAVGSLPPIAAANSAQALITFTATQPDDPATPVDEAVDAVRRASVLRHEASHGRFYVRPVYREHCRRFWREVLTERQRENIRAYLASIGYDRRDEELMLNEAQALMMNTADTRAFSAAVISMTDNELAALRIRFWQTLPAADGAGAPAAATVAPAPSASQPG